MYIKIGGRVCFNIDCWFQSFVSVSLGWWPKIYLSNKFPGDAAHWWRTTLSTTTINKTLKPSITLRLHLPFTNRVSFKVTELIMRRYINSVLVRPPLISKFSGKSYSKAKEAKWKVCGALFLFGCLQPQKLSVSELRKSRIYQN